MNRGQVYLLRAEGTNRYKVGFTEGVPTKRRDSLQTGSPFPLLLEDAYPAGQAVEWYIHGRWAPWRLHGEWFDLTTYDLSLDPEVGMAGFPEGCPRHPWPKDCPGSPCIDPTAPTDWAKVRANFRGLGTEWEMRNRTPEGLRLLMGYHHMAAGWSSRQADKIMGELVWAEADLFAKGQL